MNNLPCGERKVKYGGLERASTESSKKHLTLEMLLANQEKLLGNQKTEHDELIKKVDDIRASSQNLEGKIVMFMEMTLKFANGDKSPLAQSRSPARLTAEGDKLCKELSVRERVAANCEHICSLIDEVGSSNPYDIQKRCNDISTTSPREVFGEETHGRIKLKAFLMDLPDFLILRAAALVIRDKYFEEKGINVDDILDES
ncbi:MAG: hypothetical protein LBG30_04165 [Odoribacteraceae bacterium]|nr:hypothetical protein [Odoribacteraceae bacterium]